MQLALYLSSAPKRDGPEVLRYRPESGHRQEQERADYYDRTEQQTPECKTVVS